MNMRYTFVVTVDVDTEQLAHINEGRRRMGQQLHDRAEFCTNLIKDALSTTVTTTVEVRELKIAKRTFKSSGDVHATV